MKHIKTFENSDIKCYRKYTKGDIVYIIGNTNPFKIINTDYIHLFEHYYCEDISNPNRKNWYNEKHIIRKLEEYEIEALKYSL
jgi:hypothetical protein